MCHIFFGAWLVRRPDLTEDARRAIANLAATQVYLDELARRLARARAGSNPDIVRQATEDFACRYLDEWFPLSALPTAGVVRHQIIRAYIAEIVRGVTGEPVEG